MSHSNRFTQLTPYLCVCVDGLQLFIVDEHESSLQRAKEEHLQQLEEVKRAKESSGFVFLSFRIFSSKWN